ncbi:Uncharacterised protein [Escherichia coli]|uniref:Uncharacterized protein n=1 Tax=Escherichia coli TaxID=562 RepID=A0A376W6W1_ECOLX|nr:Uncharacterised protein [Escherichia coli]
MIIATQAYAPRIKRFVAAMAGENVVGFQRVVAEVVQLAGEDIKQNFRVGSGVDVAAFFFKQFFYATRERWSDCRCGQA